MKHLKTGHLTTDANNRIQPFIDSKRTSVANNLNDAIKMAKEGNTYHYDIYEDGKTTGLYGIPK